MALLNLLLMAKGYGCKSNENRGQSGCFVVLVISGVKSGDLFCSV